MAVRSAAGRRRAEGGIETLPSGALRVRVYAGFDSLSGRRLYLTETVKAGPTAARTAEAIRKRLLNEVAERRNPHTKATVDQLLARYLDQYARFDFCSHGRSTEFGRQFPVCRIPPASRADETNSAQ